MKGIVVQGKGEGRKYISIYTRQIEERFGFHPFPGTLNVKIGKENVDDLKKINGVMLEGFVMDGVEFGSVKCFPISLMKKDVILLIPERSRYEDIVEIIAEENLREEVGIKNGDELSFKFKPFIKREEKRKVFALPHIGEKESVITIYYDAPFRNGRRDLCFERKIEDGYSIDNSIDKGYRKTIIGRNVASIIFDGNGEKEYEDLIKWIREKNYSVASPLRKIKYSSLSEWQIDVKIKKN